MPTMDKQLRAVLDAISEVMGMFKIERALCVISATLSFCLFLYAAFRLLSVEAPSKDDILLIFGASGISTAASAGMHLYLNRSFSLIEKILANRYQNKGAGQ